MCEYTQAGPVPACIPFVEKTMIPQMVICIGDQYIEHHPPPEFLDVSIGSCSMLAQRISNLRIAASLMVASPFRR